MKLNPKFLHMFLSLCILNLLNCSLTSYPSQTLSKGTPKTLSTEKGKIFLEMEKVIFADWKVDREGLINLDDPISIQSGLKPGLEDIQIYGYILKHPVHGQFIIDTGIGDVFRKNPSEWPVSKIILSAMKLENLKIHFTTKNLLENKNYSIKGIFLTHMHIDHILGSMDIPKIPIYTGPGEPKAKSFMNLFVQGTTDRLLGEERTITELEFTQEDPNLELKILDFFGDGTLQIFHVPGHTPGSLAFLVSTKTGYNLILGDTCHTKFGWEKNVTPGEFTADQNKNRKSLDALQRIAKQINNLKIHPGHQSF